MQAANAPTPGTTSRRPPSAASKSAGQRDVGPGALDRAHDGAQVAGAVVEDDDVRGGHSEPLVDGTPVSRGSIATASRKRPGERLELRLDDVVRVPAAQHAHVQGEVGVEGDRLEDVPGQRARRYAAPCRRSRRTPGPPARRCARSRGVRTRRRRPARAPRRAARWRRRSGGCRPCRRAPRAAPGRARSRCPRRCGGRRCGCRRWCAR